jgi:hypothetical protein
MGWNDHIDDGRGPSPPIYIDGIIAMLKKEGWIEDKTFIPWTGSGGSQDGVCRFTKAGEGHDVEIIGTIRKMNRLTTRRFLCLKCVMPCGRISENIGQGIPKSLFR